MGTPLFIMGDLNSHHPMWDEMPINFGGKLIVEKLIDNEAIVTLNDGTPTLFHNAKKSGAVDLTMPTAGFAPTVEWEVLIDNSDHFPTCIKIFYSKNNTFKKSMVNSYSTRNYKKANWDEFYIKAVAQYYSDSNTNFISKINLAANGTIPYEKINNFELSSNPWWDEECKKLITNRKNAIKKFKNI